jgi:hypothetical protein
VNDSSCQCLCEIACGWLCVFVCASVRVCVCALGVCVCSGCVCMVGIKLIPCKHAVAAAVHAHTQSHTRNVHSRTNKR